MNSKLANICIGGVFGTLVGYGLYVGICKMFHFFMGYDYWSVQAGGPAFCIYAPIYVSSIIGIIMGFIGLGNGLREIIWGCVLIAVTCCVGSVVFLLLFLIVSICAGIYQALGGWPGVFAALVLGVLLIGGVGTGAGRFLLIFWDN